MMNLNSMYVGWNIVGNVASIDWISADLISLMDEELDPSDVNGDIFALSVEIDKIDINGDMHIQFSFKNLDDVTKIFIDCMSMYFKDSMVDNGDNIIVIPLKYYTSIMTLSSFLSNIDGNEMSGSFIYLSRLLISYYGTYIVSNQLVPLSTENKHGYTSLSNKDVIQLVDYNNTNLPSFNYEKDVLKYNKDTMLYIMHTLMNSFRVVHKGIMLFVIDNIPLFLTEDSIYSLDELITKIHKNFYKPSVNSNMDAELYLLDVVLRKYIKGDVELTTFTDETDDYKDIKNVISRDDMTENDYDVVGRRIIFSLIMA